MVVGSKSDPKTDGAGQLSSMTRAARWLSRFGSTFLAVGGGRWVLYDAVAHSLSFLREIRRRKARGCSGRKATSWLRSYITRTSSSHSPAIAAPVGTRQINHLIARPVVYRTLCPQLVARNQEAQKLFALPTQPSVSTTIAIPRRYQPAWRHSAGLAPSTPAPSELGAQAKSPTCPPRKTRGDLRVCWRVCTICGVRNKGPFRWPWR